jgi:hypothetical protein
MVISFLIEQLYGELKPNESQRGFYPAVVALWCSGGRAGGKFGEHRLPA